MGKSNSGNSSSKGSSSSSSSKGGSSSVSSNRVGLSSVGSNLSKKEAQQMAQSRGTSVGKIMDKAMNRGLTIGSALVNAYNSGKYSTAKDNIWKSLAPQFGSDNSRRLFGVSDNMSGLSGLKLSKGQVYGGAYSRNGELTPLVGMKGMGRVGGGKDPATGQVTPTNTPVDQTYTETPLDMPPPEPLPKEEPIKVDNSFSPGGSSSMLDGGATGFRRRRSSARTAGLTSKGTSQFKISGQSGKSSGLNIGI